MPIRFKSDKLNAITFHYPSNLIRNPDAHKILGKSIQSRNLEDSLAILDISYEWTYSQEEFLDHFYKLAYELEHRFIVLTLNEDLCQKCPDPGMFRYWNWSWRKVFKIGDKSKLIIDTSKQHSFLCLNGRLNRWKSTMLNSVSDLLEGAIWSAGGGNHSDLLPELKTQTPKYVDLNVRTMDLYQYPWLYQSTRFSLINETQVTHEANRYSEKTMFALWNNHPFLINGYYKCLELLRKDGFETFGEYIDESYDHEINSNKKQKIISDEVRRLSNLSESDWFKFYAEISPIIMHNRRRAEEIYESKLNELEHQILTSIPKKIKLPAFS